MIITVLEGELTEPEKNHLRHIFFEKLKFKKFGQKNYYLDALKDAYQVTMINRVQRQKKQVTIKSDYYDLSYLNTKKP